MNCSAVVCFTLAVKLSERRTYYPGGAVQKPLYFSVAVLSSLSPARVPSKELYCIPALSRAHGLSALIPSTFLRHSLRTFQGYDEHSIITKLPLDFIKTAIVFLPPVSMQLFMYISRKDFSVKLWLGVLFLGPMTERSCRILHVFSFNSRVLCHFNLSSHAVCSAFFLNEMGRGGGAGIWAATWVW